MAKVLIAKHKGIRIVVDEKGIFHTDPDGTEAQEKFEGITHETMMGVRKRIDDVAKAQFERFPALRLEFGSNRESMVEVMVTNVVDFYAVWTKAQDGRREKNRTTCLYKASEKNRELAAEFNRLSAEAAKLKARMSEIRADFDGFEIPERGEQ